MQFSSDYSQLLRGKRRGLHLGEEKEVWRLGEKAGAVGWPA